MAADHYTIDHGFKALTKELEKLDGMVIKIGIQADAAEIPAVDKDGKREEISVLDKAIFNEFGRSGRQGTPDGGHTGDHHQAFPTHAGSVVLPGNMLFGGMSAIPARPFVSGWADTKQQDILAKMEAVYLGVLDGKYDAQKGAGLLGEWAQGSMRNNALTFPWTPNAPATIKAKGSAQPLVDEGQMLNVIRFLIESKELTA